eukprot:gb/GECH01004070.1/.p1 GENE.gb/GECH01004070.1/~~gb/GECH01004070.1/.p1  ORF type:complete len:190 (+),score=62.53 gb/GECH01004070.1/:1-570(+)
MVDSAALNFLAPTTTPSTLNSTALDPIMNDFHDNPQSSSSSPSSPPPQPNQHQQQQQQQQRQRKTQPPKSMRQMKEHLRNLEQKNNDLHSSEQKEKERANVAEGEIDTYKQRTAELTSLIEESGINSISGQKIPEAQDFKNRLEELKNHAENRLHYLDQNLEQLDQLINSFNERNPNESVDLADSMITN